MNTKTKNTPVWLKQPRKQYPEYEGLGNYDVAVIGGGITGLTSAYLLKKAGKRVAVFEKNQIGEGETGHTTAHLVYFTDTHLQKLVNNFGDKTAQAVWQSGIQAIDLIEEIVRKESIVCEFQRVPGFLMNSMFGADTKRVNLKHEAELGRKLGFSAIYRESLPLVDRAGVEYPDQASFDPIAYLSGLAKAIDGGGSAIYEKSEVTDSIRDQQVIKVKGHELNIDKIIMATHVPLTGYRGTISAMSLQTKLYGYSTYAVGGKIKSQLVPAGSYNDTQDPYHYLRVSFRSGQSYAILGGEDHKTGQASDIETRYARLEQKLQRLFPQTEIDSRWSGQVIETNDGLPYIGPSNDNQFTATGYSGNGMTFGTVAAILARDWIMGTDNPWQEIYRPSRTHLKSGLWDYLKENKDYPIELIIGYLKDAPSDSIDSVKLGEGKVLEIGGQRRAVYRRPDGIIENCSAICTHLGCVVRWNASERTWDCSCHGSRFETNGDVLAGPAELPLKRASDSQAH